MRLPSACCTGCCKGTTWSQRCKSALRGVRRQWRSCGRFPCHGRNSAARSTSQATLGLLRSVRDFARKEWPPSGAVRLTWDVGGTAFPGQHEIAIRRSRPPSPVRRGTSPGRPRPLVPAEGRGSAQATVVTPSPFALVTVPGRGHPIVRRRPGAAPATRHWNYSAPRQGLPHPTSTTFCRSEKSKREIQAPMRRACGAILAR